MSASRQAVSLSITLYVAWVAATYLLEGRVGLLQRPDPVGRALYAVVANILIGTAIAAWIVRSLIGSGVVTAQQVGLRRLGRTLIAALAAAVLAFGLFLLPDPRSLEPLVLLNVFAQVLPTSIAEVLVCWAVAGATAESLTRSSGRWVSLLAGIAAAAVLFGVYHFAHSPPFNQVGVVVFLTLVGVGTGLVYFFGRDVYATVIVHNVLAMVGILNSAEPAAFRQPLYPLYLLALAGAATLVAAHALIARTAPGR